MMFPLLAIGLIAVPILLTLKPPSATFRQRLGEVDWFGGALFTLSITSFLVAISWGGLQYAWNSWQTILPLIAGIVGIAGAIYYEGWWAKRPVLLPALFHNLSSTMTFLCGSFQGLLVSCALLFLFDTLQLHLRCVLTLLVSDSSLAASTTSLGSSSQSRSSPPSTLALPSYQLRERPSLAP